MNPLLKELCPSSQMILMKLATPDVDGSACEYMRALRALVRDLPPMLLMNSSTHLPVITRYIWGVCWSCFFHCGEDVSLIVIGSGRSSLSISFSFGDTK